MGSSHHLLRPLRSWSHHPCGAFHLFNRYDRCFHQHRSQYTGTVCLGRSHYPVHRKDGLVFRDAHGYLRTSCCGGHFWHRPLDRRQYWRINTQPPRRFSEAVFFFAYLNNLKSQFNGSVIIPEAFKHEWMYIPHIVHTPFYCYAYPFGELLGLSLYEDYLDNREVGLKKIKGILSSGSSKDPAQLLKDYGYDLNGDGIWTKGFEYIAKMIDKLKSLI